LPLLVDGWLGSDAFAWGLAYIDPGTGAMLWQVIAAVFIGLLFYVRRIVDWMASKFRRRAAHEDEPRS